MENQQKLYQILSRVLHIPVEIINDRTAPENVNTWDSMNALLLVAELETLFNVKFTLAEVISTKDVGGIKTLLAKHGVIL